MNICVYGASSSVIDKVYISGGEELGQKLAERGHSVVYGGGAEGMMGAVSRGAYSSGGKIIGIAPSFFKVDGVLYEHCTEFIYTDTMRERKKLMEDSSDGFLVTPGGIGTFDEFFEILTLRQLNQHQKPIAIFNINGYFDPMTAMLKSAAEQKFMTNANQKLYFVSDSAEEIINYFEGYKAEKIELSELKHIKSKTN